MRGDARLAQMIDEPLRALHVLFPITQQSERAGSLLHSLNNSQPSAFEGISQPERESVCRTRSRAARNVRRHAMTRLTILATAALLSLMSAVPVVGQPVTWESGTCPTSAPPPGAAVSDRRASDAAAPAPSARPLPAGCETTTRPWSAPVGHRQPQVADVPSSPSPSEQTLDQEDANVDRVVRGICRGC
jgi:hypothetical protein